MLLSTFPPQSPYPSTHSNYCFTALFPLNHNKPHPHCPCRATVNTSAQRPLCLAATASTPLRQVTFTSDDDEVPHDDDDSMVSSAAAIVAAILAASTSPVEFVQRIEKDSKALVLPSQDFQRLCLEQLDLFRRIVHPDALLSV